MTSDQLGPLLDELLAPPVDREWCVLYVCTSCGLGRPARSIGTLSNPAPPDSPKPLPACPHCGSPEWMWSTRTGREPQPWWNLPGTMPQPFAGKE